MTYDIAVIGAGPAGATASALLARLGARVALVDPSHPREKPCGGGVTGRALALIESMVPLSTLECTRVRAARFIDTATRLSASVPLGSAEAPTLVVASRAHFDGALYAAAQASGSEVIVDRATQILKEDGRFRIHTAAARCISASFIVGADGANGLVRRQLASPFGRRQLSIATGFYASGETSSEIVIEMVDDPPGYIWSFPRPDHLAIGICAQADAGIGAGALRARVARWIQATGIGRQARLRPYSWPIPSLSASDFDTLPLAGAGWLTIGDAAGLVDPITREGIFFALQSAAFAARSLAADRNREAQFVDRVRAEIIDELKRAARFKAGFFRPRFRLALLDGLRTSDRVRQVMADLVAGAQPYRGLKRRLLRTLEFKMAWNVLTASYSRLALGLERSAE